jgi:uroporphyrin-III C-methyltransferase/precorrin-2 dehydrogenase/sirohydrochlorin ferrochelatase
MRHYPAFFDIAGRSCLVVGGGAGAAAKIRLLRRAGADVTIVAPRLNAELCALAERGEVALIVREFRAEDVAGRALVHAASGSAETDEAVARAARERNIPVNVVDRAALSSFVMPAIIDRGEITVAISSGGASPVLARRLRAEIEALLPHGLDRLARFARSFRAAVRGSFADGETRLRFWQGFFDGPLADAVLAGRESKARRDMMALINGAELPATGESHDITVDPDAPDLLTLRDARRIARAEVVVHDAEIGAAILDHARRDALFVETRAGEGAGFAGKRVVRLTAHRGARLAAI